MRFAERLRALIQRVGTVRVIVALGLAGMALILFSGLAQKDEPAQSTAETAAVQSAVPDADAYRTDLETRLAALLTRMDGVGTVTVMLTVSGSAEQVYAEEVKESGSDRSAQRESSPVLTRNGSGESALIAETRFPQVTGAAVLCTGGAHAAVRERVTQAVSTVLGLPTSQIYVGASS